MFILEYWSSWYYPHSEWIVVPVEGCFRCVRLARLRMQTFRLNYPNRSYRITYNGRDIGD